MCGIVGYVGNRAAQDVVYQGLSRLEYRGYDSVGIAVQERSSHRTRVAKAPGKLKEVKKYWAEIDVPSVLGIGHTRWATHGVVNQVNAHPHRVGSVTIVHNGIIENHFAIRAELEAGKARFASDTDSELFAHLVARERGKGKDLFSSVRSAFLLLEGSSAFVVIDEESPGEIVVAKNGPPLVLGFGKNENLVASDVPAMLEYTRDVYYLKDNELAWIKADGVKVFDKSGKPVDIAHTKIEWDLDAIDKQGYPHYMLKEIHEQPQAVSDTVAAWLDLAQKRFRLSAAATSKIAGQERKTYNHAELAEVFSHATQVHVVACGSAWHAGLFGQNILEKIAGIPARAELASEFRYREPVLKPTDVGLVVSQSGETADTLAAVKQMRAAGLKVFAICNVRDSSIARECEAVFYTNAGIEIGVASTKAFLTQMVMFAILGAALAAHRGRLHLGAEREWVDALSRLPAAVKEALLEAPKLEALAKKYAGKKGFLFLGRGPQHAVALEGALKFKEIAYVHAEGYPSGELKHGPIAMVEPDMLVLALAPEGEGLLHSKSVSNIEEVRARKGTLLGFGSSEDKHFRKICDDFVPVARTGAPELLAVTATVALQLLSYYVAVERGTEVDQPRNLAKSVTVE